MRLTSETKALEMLRDLKSEFRKQIAEGYEYRAKSCLTCETQGACCLDAHFVNVHISRLEAVSIRKTIDGLADEKRDAVYERVENTVKRYALEAEGDTFKKTYACPLFEKGTGCMVHNTGKPAPCMTHACYESKADLPPDKLLTEHELSVDELNLQTYGRPHVWLPLPVAISRKV